MKAMLLAMLHAVAIFGTIFILKTIDAWECSARDTTNGQCVEYSLKKFPATVTYEGEK